MGIYSKAGPDVYEQIAGLVDGYHPELAECQFKVYVLFIHPGKQLEKPPLTSNGYPVPGVVRKTSLEDRMSGAADAKFILDAQAWHNYTEAEQNSLLDRLLHRLEVQRDKTGAIKTDDAGRPTLKLRKYDYLICGYDSVIRRYGTDAIDARDIADLSLHYQTLLPISQPAVTHK